MGNDACASSTETDSSSVEVDLPEPNIATSNVIEKRVHHPVGDASGLVECRIPLLSLATEIVLEIIRMTLPTPWSGFRDDPFPDHRRIIKRISLVCRRFRELILHCAEAWCCLDLTFLSGTNLDLFLRRSQKAQLSVFMRDPHFQKDDTLKIIEHKDRVEALYLEVWDEDLDSLPGPPPVVFPAVKVLSISGDRYRTSQDAVFGSWLFPKAERVDLENILPQGCDPLPNSTSMRSLRIKPNYKATTDKTYFMSMAQLLRPAVNLETLTIDLSLFDGVAHLDGVGPVELPSMQNLRITNSNTEDSFFNSGDVGAGAGTFARITKLLKLPNLQRLSALLMIFYPSFDVRTFLNDAFPLSNGFHRLTELTFSVQWLRRFDDEPQRLELPLDAFWNHFPELDSLLIRADRFVLRAGDIGKMARPKIRTLYLHIPSLKPRNWYQLCGELYRDGMRLQRLAIDDYGLDETIVGECFPGTQIRLGGIPMKNQRWTAPFDDWFDW